MSVLLLFVVVVYIAVIMIVLILVTTVKGIVETTRTTIGTLTSNKLVATMLGHHRQDVSESTTTILRGESDDRNTEHY